MKKINNKHLLTIIIFIVFFSLFVLSFFQLESDYLWHIKAGEYMFNNGILRKDVFSWTVYSKYWMSHEWLFEVFIYSLKRLFGNYHIFIYCLLNLELLSFILFFSNREKYMKNSCFALIWLSAFIFIVPFVQARPYLISYNLLAVTLYLLFDLYKNEDSKKIYFLPLISILWANFHGGSSNLPYILCFIFILGGLFKFSFGKIEGSKLTDRQKKKYLLVMFLCMLSVCINIHGFKMFIYPYQNMMDSTMISNIIEWESTGLDSFIGYAYYLLLFLIVVVLLISNRKIKLIHFLLLLFAVFLGIKSIRFVFFTYIFSSFIIFDYIKERKFDEGFTSAVIIFSIFLIGCFIYRRDYVFIKDYKYLVDDRIIELIKITKPKRLYNDYDIGGDLVYNDIPVFIDGRADLYSKYNFKDAIDIIHLKNDATKLIRRYDFDYLLVKPNEATYNYLMSNKNYDLLYSGERSALFKKV